MQFISFCLFTIICSYSLVISAPVNQAVPDTQETKQQKATAIASRLLKELAGEQSVSQPSESSSNTDESKDAIAPAVGSTVEKVESHVVKPTNTFDNEDEEEEFDFIPTLEDIYEFYGDKFAQAADHDDDDSSFESTNDADYILPIGEQQLLRYLAEQEENDAQLTPVIHTPVMDDTIMTAEDHQRRRRRSIY